MNLSFREMYLKIKKEIETIDTKGFIYKKGEWGEWDSSSQQLAEIISIIKYNKLSPKDIVLFEFGPKQEKIGIPTNDSAQNPGVSHFFAFYKLMPYFAFDVRYTEEKLKENINQFKEEKEEMTQTKLLYEIFERSAYSPYIDIDIDKLEEDIKKMSFQKYSGIKKEIIKTIEKGKTPVLFSLNVLNAPAYDFCEKIPFWQEKNCLQIHGVNIPELEKKINETYKNKQKYIYEFQKIFNITTKPIIKESEAYEEDQFIYWNN